MTNTPAIFRSLIIYAVCVVLAVFLGVMLANPLTYSQLFVYGILGFVLAFPILLRWHYPLLLLSWNLSAVVIFLPGRPSLFLLMVALSLGISVFQRMLSKESQFISVPQITLPLFCLIGVIVFTAKMTGVGLHIFGSQVYGGQKYFYLMAGILAYFALSARRIPPERKNLYLGLYFLGGAAAFIGDLLPILPHPFYVIYSVFNPNVASLQTAGTARFPGITLTSSVVLAYMLARYGLRGIFLSHRPLRWLTFCLFSFSGLFGGFRGFIVYLGLLLTVLFFLEGLHRTKWLPIALISGIVGAIALFPLAPHLPWTFQRALTIVPLPYHLSEEARFDAQHSLDWRLQMWQAVLPEARKHLLLGKGYVINPIDYKFVMGPEASIRSALAQNDPMALAENFHNGPLSVTIPFGIWGDIAFLWFLAAGLRVLYLNYRYGDPGLRVLNTFLFAAFITESMYFMVVYGALSSYMARFTGLLGLSVAFNNGVRRRVRTTQPVPQRGQNRTPIRVTPSPAPAFQRRQPGTSR